MIDDLNRLPNNTTLDCDLCIVGTGAAGLLLATELLHSGLKIILLESGGAKDEADSQNLYDSVITGLPFNGHVRCRFRIYGGSTTRWGGQSLRLDRLDFEPRDWVAHSGWPLKLDDLVSYYQRASAFMLTDLENFDTDLFPVLHLQPPEFDQNTIHYHFSKWNPRPNLRSVYGPAIEASKDVQLLMHANVTCIDLSESLSHVRELQIRSLRGASATVRPRLLVLCAGGIENARILLTNNHQQKNGIGNDHDLVGRFFQDHPAGVAGELQPRDSNQIQRIFNTFYRRGLKYAPRISMAEKFQIQNRLLNVSAYLAFEASAESWYGKFKEGIAWIRRRQANLTHIKNVSRGLLHLPTIIRPVFEYFVRHHAYVPNPVIRLVLNTEQEPNPQSRIVLSDQTDALGIRRSEIRWQLTELSHKTVNVYCQALREQFHRLNLGELRLADWTQADAPDWRSGLGDQCHHMGTTRMDDSPQRGVVDRDGKIHGIDNFYIAGSSVFPTCGHSNPTLTLMALTIRMADQLKAMMRPG